MNILANLRVDNKNTGTEANNLGGKGFNSWSALMTLQMIEFGWLATFLTGTGKEMSIQKFSHLLQK